MEVLQADLLEEDLLEHILSLLQDAELEVGVRYFAGGILAQLTSRPEAWTLSDELRTTIVKQLVCMSVCVCEGEVNVWMPLNFFLSLQHTSIMTWTQLEREMVSYR